MNSRTELSSAGPSGLGKIVIVGAGPAGLLLALMLGQQGIPVTVLEAWGRLDERLRATQYGTPATRVFRKAGVLDEIRAAGIERFPSISWRKVDPEQTRITGIDLTVTKDEPDRTTVLPLNLLLKILLEHCKRQSSIEVKFEHKVIEVGQNESKAWADAVMPSNERKRFEGDYVIGCDGASSTVRQQLFGRNWPGITWDHSLLVQNVFYDGFTEHGWSGGNYMIDPNHWGLIAERGKGGLWRVTYGDIGGLTHEQYLKRREEHFEAMFPGHPKPDQYRVEQTDQFRIHNRCVEKMRVGRILLAADAAHVCNPFGGYGLMVGVLDIDGLTDCLIGMHQRKVGDEILDKYAEIRREKFLNYVEPRSIKNMNRLRAQNPDSALRDDKFLQILAHLEKDPEEAKAFLLKFSSIEHDFKQYYII
ncbi:FAD/NAD(P)-binding domain-containing protein [Glonium stellatum]|uniref:FAD/NAD(P)-binding domain-containing protein n=1 Tax=Glonium stellatum TaxID=574774 RepID=A0A8E2ESJ7_9PEZI|nr:FAD/NAD(P)-binding domain-containing protein [Glonium stellatum]